MKIRKLFLVVFTAILTVMFAGCATMGQQSTETSAADQGRNYRFRMLLEEPLANSEQPMKARKPAGKNSNKHSKGPQTARPANTDPALDETIIITPDLTPDSMATHPYPHSAGGGGTGHCHYWIKIGGNWYQVHC